MTDVLLVAFPARYAHTSFALYRLMANLGTLEARSDMLELTSDLVPAEAAALILARRPRIVGFSVYLWSLEQSLAVAEVLRSVSPETVLIAGGPQVVADCAASGFGIDPYPMHYAIAGEGEAVFAALCLRLLQDERPVQRWWHAPAADLERLASPYRLYTENDIRHRVLYVETSRGCPHQCAYCTSADQPGGLRRFPLNRLFDDLDALLARGARRMKLLDRSFDADVSHAAAVLDFFLSRLSRYPGLHLHLEWVPVHLPELLRKRLAAFPPGALHLELGVQTLDAAVAARVGRQGDPQRAVDHIVRLMQTTGAALHLDLIIGLPGETLEGFALGFDRLAFLGPHALQVNPLKRLPGTPLDAAADEQGMCFNPRPPYTVLASDVIDFTTMLRLCRFAHVWDRLYNRERDPERRAAWCAPPSPFARVLAFSEVLFQRHGRVHAIARNKRLALMESFLSGVGSAPDGVIRA